MTVLQDKLNTKEVKKMGKRNALLMGMFVFSLIFMTGFVMADTSCVGQNCATNTTITVTNDAPVVTWVEAISAVTLTANSTTNTRYVLFNVTDSGSVGDINATTAQCSAYKSGEVLRNSSSCTEVYSSGNLEQFNCTIDFAFYDVAAADWVFNCSIEDTSSALGWNDTQVFTINTLDAVYQDVYNFAWSSATVSTNDQEADNKIVIKNLGNEEYDSSTTLTAQNATYSSSTILAGWFAVGPTTATPGTATTMVDNTATALGWFTLPNGPSATEELYAYLDLGAVQGGTYNSIADWTLSVNI